MNRILIQQEKYLEIYKTQKFSESRYNLYNYNIDIFLNK